ncbi:OmpH family outer membrane protein [Pontibacter chitinilyticus]|uniref:OmpH family outer membrane protein n=1 Tax=Pontibacter chitinilyticus TaxID=2674989 RepID=UPI00321B4255
MKVSNIALGVAAAALMTACNKEQKPNADATTPATTANTESTVAPGEKIVYVNSDSLLANYGYFKDVRTRLEDKSKKAEANLRSKADAFQKEVGRYQQSAQGMTNEQRASTEQRLQQTQQQLQTLNQTTSTQLASEESEEMKKIYDNVEAYLKQLSQDKGYKMVLTYSRGNSAILYGDSSLDITQEVLAALNEKYYSEKAESSKPKSKK